MTTKRGPDQPPVSYLILQREIPAAVFKARCLEIMDEVHRTGESVTITKHRKPVAQLVPVPTPRKGGFVGSMAGQIKILGDIVGPIDDQEWTGDEENLT
jgi:prevent-host-death family protein